MATIIQLVQRYASAILNPVIFRNSSFETALEYDRTDGKRIEFVIVHLAQAAGDNHKPPFLAIASRSIKRNPNYTPNSLLNLSMEEARLLRDFLNRDETHTWLEEE